MINIVLKLSKTVYFPLSRPFLGILRKGLWLKLVEVIDKIVKIGKKHQAQITYKNEICTQNQGILHVLCQIQGLN